MPRRQTRRGSPTSTPPAILRRSAGTATAPVIDCNRPGERERTNGPGELAEQREQRDQRDVRREDEPEAPRQLDEGILRRDDVQPAGRIGHGAAAAATSTRATRSPPSATIEAHSHPNGRSNRIIVHLRDDHVDGQPRDGGHRQRRAERGRTPIGARASAAPAADATRRRRAAAPPPNANTTHHQAGTDDSPHRDRAAPRTSRRRTRSQPAIATCSSRNGTPSNAAPSSGPPSRDHPVPRQPRRRAHATTTAMPGSTIRSGRRPTRASTVAAHATGTSQTTRSSGAAIPSRHDSRRRRARHHHQIGRRPTRSGDMPRRSRRSLLASRRCEHAAVLAHRVRHRRCREVERTEREHPASTP